MEYLKSHPCVGCGETDILVLEFDHEELKSERKKPHSVTDLLKHSRARLIKEIEKCEVRCANCHKRRTAIQMDSYRLRFC
jgi:hypothetical protein